MTQTIDQLLASVSGHLTTTPALQADIMKVAAAKLAGKPIPTMPQLAAWIFDTYGIRVHSRTVGDWITKAVASLNTKGSQHG